MNPSKCGAVAAAALALCWIGRSTVETQTPAAGAAPRSRSAERQGLAEPFKGVTADGRVPLSTDQRTRTAFPVDDDEWRKWMNQHFYVRQGVSFLELSPSQRDAGIALLDHQTPANLRHLAANPQAPNHEHIHVVVRTPNGNDYGKDLLRQHYAQHPHSAAYGNAMPR